MSARPKTSSAVAEVLREHPPTPDDLTRVRMEQRVIAASLSARRSRRPVRAIAAGTIALAAAAAMIIWVLRDPDAPVVARFERHEASASVERGTLEEGSTLHTAEQEVAEIRVVDSRVRIEGASRVRIATLSQDRLALDLDEGAVRVAFHPRERGRERMTVETPSARVEVVGTVFRVEVHDGETRVSVSEGTVRVVPLDGGAPRLVHQGEETRVEARAQNAARETEGSTTAAEIARPGEARSADVAPESGAAETIASNPPESNLPESNLPESNPPEEAPEHPGEPEATTEREDDEPSDPHAALEEAARLIESGRTARAMPILRQLTRPSVPAAVRTEAWLRVGDVSEHEGRMPQAAHAYEEAERAGRGTSQGHNATFSLARLEDRRLHDAEAARASYERYRTDAPDGALASQARAALCRLGVSERCGGAP